MIRTMKRIIGLVLICLSLVVQQCWAMGLEVNPNNIDVMNVPLGKKVAVSALAGRPQKVRIKNKSGTAFYYEINILQTAKTTSPLREGYQDIPNPNWIIPEEKEVRIEANQTKEVELYVNIPKKTGYANKNYQAVIEVKSKKNNQQEVFVLACQTGITFQTEKPKAGERFFRRWLEWIKQKFR